MKTIRCGVCLSLAALALAGCGAPTQRVDGAARQAASTPPVDATPASLPFSSPECLAARLPAGDPFPASAIPPAAQAARQSGVVAIRYDVVGGTAQNLQVVSSTPPGLYDGAALQHAARYRAPAAPTVRGCVTVVEVKF